MINNGKVSKRGYLSFQKVEPLSQNEKGGDMYFFLRVAIIFTLHDHQFAPVRQLVPKGISAYMFFYFRLFAGLSFRAETRNPGSVSIPWIPSSRILGDKFSGNEQRVCTDYRRGVGVTAGSRESKTYFALINWTLDI